MRLIIHHCTPLMEGASETPGLLWAVETIKKGVTKTGSAILRVRQDHNSGSYNNIIYTVQQRPSIYSSFRFVAVRSMPLEDRIVTRRAILFCSCGHALNFGGRIAVSIHRETYYSEWRRRMVGRGGRRRAMNQWTMEPRDTFSKTKTYGGTYLCIAE